MLTILGVTEEMLRFGLLRTQFGGAWSGYIQIGEEFASQGNFALTPAQNFYIAGIWSISIP
jgi:hypothetical protein